MPDFYSSPAKLKYTLAYHSLVELPFYLNTRHGSRVKISLSIRVTIVIIQIQIARHHPGYPKIKQNATVRRCYKTSLPHWTYNCAPIFVQIAGDFCHPLSIHHLISVQNNDAEQVG